MGMISQIDILAYRDALARFDPARDTFCFLATPVAIFPRSYCFSAIADESNADKKVLTDVFIVRLKVRGGQ